MFGKLSLIILLISAQTSFAQVDSVKILLKGEWHLTHYKSTPFKINTTAEFVNIEKDSVVKLIVGEEFLYFIETNRYQNKIFKIDTTTYYYHIAEDQGLDGQKQYRVQLHADKNQNVKSSRLENILSIVKINHTQLHLKFSTHAIRAPLLQMATASYFFQKSKDALLAENIFEGEWFVCNKNGLNLNQDTILLSRDSCFFITSQGCKNATMIKFQILKEEDNYTINEMGTCGSFIDYTHGTPLKWSLGLKSNVIYLQDKDKTNVYRFNMDLPILTLIRIYL